jgi:UDP-N-acetylmuramoylalanine--D-glutamate ligase
MILIAGGYDKSLPFDQLGRVLAKKVKVLVLMGKTAEKIELSVKASPEYKENCPKILYANNMEEAVKIASESANPGDIVALSPACASFDLYPNFAARGTHFKQLITNLTIF